MRGAALIAAAVMALACSACATTSGGDPLAGRSYRLDSGAADYDSLQRATALCNSRGGSLKPDNGADLTELSSYSCVIAKDK